MLPDRRDLGGVLPQGVCDDLHFYDEIERYEREVLTKRG